MEKLQVLERTSNGFDIAEADWALRGPGDLLGTAQSGLPPFRIGSLMRDAELMQLARGAAFVIIERDPKLTEPGNQVFRTLMQTVPEENLSQVS